ncbi:MAG: MlaA family lipoprotein, partial [Rhodospirillaceae bacterium]
MKSIFLALLGRFRRTGPIVVLGSALALGACSSFDSDQMTLDASAPQTAQAASTDADTDSDELISDPLEPWNRYVFAVNDLIYTLAQPWIAPYMVLPQEGKDAVDNFLHNLQSPVILVNDLLQGDLDRAWTTTARFGINSTVGIGGILDVAADHGLERHSEDFGQTLGTYGAGDGPYLVLPLFGPSNPRDAVGRVVDFVTDPLFWVNNDTVEAFNNARTYATVSNQLGRNYGDLEALRSTSLDYYATIRALYIQRRRAEVSNTENDPSAASQDYDFDFDDPETETAN